MTSVHVRFGILGPLQVIGCENTLDLGPRKQRIVLAALLCNANSLVSVDSLAKALWDGAPPRTARKNIQVYVCALRGLASSGSGPRISYQSGGYVFHANASELDSLRFEQQARMRHRLRQGGQPGAIADALTEALDLWRGPVLEGMRDVPLISAAARRLEQEFLAVFEDWAEAEIAVGGAAGVIERIADVAREHPLRERLRTLQMTALCHAGRRSEAVAIYDELRQSLAHELGLSPSPAVVRAYEWLLSEQPGASVRRQAPPSLLPWEPPMFVGREACTRKVTGALVGSGHRIAVLTGPLGVGKTALAVHAAHQLGGSFPDGRFFVRLRDEDGILRPTEDVISQLVSAALPGTEARQDSRLTWQLWLARHRALILVDDARQESEVRPLLPEAGDSAAIVTARTRLGGLETACRVQLPPLTLAEGLEFLGRVIGPGRVSADRGSAERIVSAAGSLPLGIRLAAERLALLRHVPLRDYAVRIERSSTLLDELAVGDVSIRGRLARAMGELPGPLRQDVVRLGVLPASVFTINDAAAVLDADEDATARVLETLLEAGVITVPDVEAFARTVLYEMPALTYAYACEMAAR